jgi:Tol biopolymer transport system component
MYMHDISYRGVSPDKILKPPLGVLWKFKTGGPVDSSPIVVDKTVYVGSDDHRLYALYADKWGVKWYFEADDRIISAPTYYRGNIYFSARDNKVYALNAATGEKRWEFQADGWINSPVVAFRQRIYLGCYDSKIYVLDADTGKKDSQKSFSIEIGGYKYISSQGEFYPIDARQRASRWRQHLPVSESWPATANGVAYIGGRDNKLHAFDINTGNEIWSFQTDGWVDSSPAIADGMLFIGSRDGYIYALKNAEALPETKQEKITDKQGVVTQDKARVYSRLDNMSEVIAELNEGRLLNIKGRKSGNWYQVILPDERTGWMSDQFFTPIRWSEDLQVNDPLVENIKSVILPKDAEKPSWSPGGSVMVFFDDISTQNIYWRAKSVWVSYADGENPKWVADGAFYNARISWTGNGDWFSLENLARTQRQVWMVRSNGTGLRKVAEGEAPSLSPDGRGIAFIRRNSTLTTVWVHRLDTGEQEKLAEIPILGQESYAVYSYIADINLPVWSPDSLYLAVGLDGHHYEDNYSRVVIINASGGIVREIAFRSRRIEDIAWSPDGNRLAYITEEHSFRNATKYLDKKVHLVNLSESIREEIFERSEGLAWSPDGKYLAFIQENDCMGMIRKVYILNTKTLQLTQLVASRENIHRIFWFSSENIALVAALPPSEEKPKTRAWILSTSALGN